MKLAEALQIRADLQKRIAQMQMRLNNNATVQQGTLPAENPVDLLAETDRMFKQLEELITRINLTNSRVDHDGVTLTALIAKRDCLKQHIGLLRDFINNASQLARRHSLSEILVVSTVDVAEQQRQVDRLSKELRELDTKIQSLNWTIDLL